MNVILLDACNLATRFKLYIMLYLLHFAMKTTEVFTLNVSADILQ